MAAYCRVYGFGHLRADCRGPGSALDPAPEPYARFEYRNYLYIMCVQYLTAHLRRIVRESAAAAAGNDSLTSSSAPPPGGHDSKQVLYAKYCLRHVAAPRTHTRKLPPSDAEIEVKQ